MRCSIPRRRPGPPRAASLARSDHGQALPLALSAVVLAAVVILALIPLAAAAAERAMARTAADAAALAGAAEGEEAAREIAAANGAELVLWGASGQAVWVEVRVGRARAEAMAVRDLAGAWSAPGSRSDRN